MEAPRDYRREWLKLLGTLVAAPAAVALGAALLLPQNPLAFLLLLAGVLVALLYLHSQRLACRCPDCDDEFEISPFADLANPRIPALGKYVHCPRCGAREWAEIRIRERRTTPR